MSNTLKHKINAKYKNSIENKEIYLGDIPITVIKMWSRHNFNIGYYRYLRNKKREDEYKRSSRYT